MTDTYALRIADFLTGSARQIILMLARQQWELVSEKIEPFAGRIYMFHYHTTLEKVRSLPPEDFVYEVRGTQNSLLHTLPVSERNPYTEVKELN